LLLLEDDPAIARTVAYTLERDGLAVTHSLLLRDARQQVQARAFDLLVLDVGLPDGSGLDLLQQVRNTPAPTAAGTPGTPGTPSATPVLMLSARGEELDRVLGLELGADDYLTKPFSPRELAARVKALLRRAGAPAAAPAAPPRLFHDDTVGQRISLHGQPLPLTRREYRLLACLLAGAGRIHTRDALLAAAWGDDSDSHRPHGGHPHQDPARQAARGRPVARVHQTHRGMGYCLNL
jgi:two-component system catabolic regulation response regulator CreB